VQEISASTGTAAVSEAQCGQARTRAFGMHGPAGAHLVLFVPDAFSSPAYCACDLREGKAATPREHNQWSWAATSQQ